MASVNQLCFLRHHARLLEGPYLEIRSVRDKAVADIPRLFDKQAEFLRVCAQDGLDIDLVVDLTESYKNVRECFDRRQFGTIFCMSALEECHQPFALAENLTRLLRDDGKICLAGSFAATQKPAGPDFWRFTPAGIQRLFPFLVFRPDEAAAASSIADEFFPLESPPFIPFDPQCYRQKGFRLRGAVIRVLTRLAKFGLLRWLAGYPYLLVPTEILMIGRLPSGNAAKLKVLLEREDEVFAPDPKTYFDDLSGLKSSLESLADLPKQ
jgi:hypothetical protein